MKTKKLVLGACILAGIVILLLALLAPYAISVVKNQDRLRQYESRLQETALQYLERNVENFDKADWNFAGLMAEEKNSDIEQENNRADDDSFVYPYAKVELYFKTSGMDGEKWIVFFEKNENGELSIVRYSLVEE